MIYGARLTVQNGKTLQELHMTEKIKIFTISDHPLSPSGVGTQTKYIIESMLKTGKYQYSLVYDRPTILRLAVGDGE